MTTLSRAERGARFQLSAKLTHQPTQEEVERESEHVRKSFSLTGPSHPQEGISTADIEKILERTPCILRTPSELPPHPPRKKRPRSPESDQNKTITPPTDGDHLEETEQRPWKKRRVVLSPRSLPSPHTTAAPKATEKSEKEFRPDSALSQESNPTRC